MADLHDYFFRQRVTEQELDEGFELLEQADRDIAVDLDYIGIASGAVLSEQGVPNLTMAVSGGVAYSKTGERIGITSTAALDLSVDENTISTEPSTPGNSLVISVFVEFARTLSDPRIDGNSATVYFNRFESFNFVIRKGSEAATPAPGAEEAFIGTNGSPLDPDLILLADVLRANGETALNDVDVFTFRRESMFKMTAGAMSIDVGTAELAVQAMLQLLNDHINDIANAHSADTIIFDPAGIPAEWSALAAATEVQAAVEAMVDDLGQVTGTSGADLIGVDPVGALVSTNLQTILESELGILAGGQTWTGKNFHEAPIVTRTHDGDPLFDNWQDEVRTFAETDVVPPALTWTIAITDDAGAQVNTKFVLPDDCTVMVHIDSVMHLEAAGDGFRAQRQFYTVTRAGGTYTIENATESVGYNEGAKHATPPALTVNASELAVLFTWSAAAETDTFYIATRVRLLILSRA